MLVIAQTVDQAVVWCVCRPVATFNRAAGRDPRAWDLMFLDEGHKIKNHNTQQYKALRELHGRMRVIITGTPVQARRPALPHTQTLTFSAKHSAPRLTRSQHCDIVDNHAWRAQKVEMRAEQLVGVPCTLRLLRPGPAGRSQRIQARVR